MMGKQENDGWIDNSISVMQLNIGRLEVNCFDEDAEMSIRVGKSSYQSLSVDEAKELASFIVSHIKNETEANPETISSDTLPVSGESEAIGERKFTLKEALEIWQDGLETGSQQLSSEGDTIWQAKCFKDKFGIDI